MWMPSELSAASLAEQTAANHIRGEHVMSAAFTAHKRPSFADVIEETRTNYRDRCCQMDKLGGR